MASNALPTADCDQERQHVAQSCPELDPSCLQAQQLLDQGLGETLLVTIGGKQYVLKKIDYSDQAAQEAQRLIDLPYSPYLVCYLARFKLDGKLGILSEYVQGVALDKLIPQLQQTGQTEPDQVIKAIVGTALKALQHLHSNGIAFRDLKPAHVFAFQDQCKLVDIGLKAYECSAQWPNTTTRYMAPELLQSCLNGTAQPDMQKADIWSLGLVMAELVTLNPLALLQGPNRADFYQQQQALPSKLQAWRTSPRAELQAIAQMLTLDPAQRPSAAQLLQQYFPGL